MDLAELLSRMLDRLELTRELVLALRVDRGRDKLLKLLLAPGESLQGLFDARDLLLGSGHRGAGLPFAVQKALGVVRQVGFGADVGVETRGELAVLCQTPRGVFERPPGRHLLSLATPDFLIGGARVGQIATSADELLREFLDRDGIRQLAVPPAVLGKFAKLGIECRQLGLMLAFDSAPTFDFS